MNDNFKNGFENQDSLDSVPPIDDLFPRQPAEEENNEKTTESKENLTLKDLSEFIKKQHIESQSKGSQNREKPMVSGTSERSTYAAKPTSARPPSVDEFSKSNFSTPENAAPKPAEETTSASTTFSSIEDDSANHVQPFTHTHETAIHEQFAEAHPDEPSVSDPSISEPSSPAIDSFYSEPIQDKAPENEYTNQSYYQNNQNPYYPYADYPQNNIPAEQNSSYPLSDANLYSFQTPENESARSGGIAVKKSKGLVIFSVIMCILFLASILILGAYVANNQGSSTANNSANTENGLTINSTPDNQVSAVASGEKLDTVQIAEKVTPSVVGIVIYAQSGSSASEGSGVIMSSDGYIISNAHVFVDTNNQVASTIKVVLNDGTEHDAKLIGIDTSTDLAVIKIEAEGLIAAEFGDSTKLKVGENVVAIGNPTGLTLASSLTKGIVSGIDRAIGTGYATTFIQTDAAINPGNSGGALVNEYGQVIGINSAKIADTDYEGLGFAIPISEAQPIVDSLVANGYVKDRVKIGIYYRVIDETTAAMNNYPSGLYIEEVDPAYDIAQKGVRKGDIITAVDGEEITSSEEMIALLKTKSPGDTLKLTLFRTTTTTNQTFTIEITLEEDKSTAVSPSE